MALDPTVLTSVDTALALVDLVDPGVPPGPPSEGPTVSLSNIISYPGWILGVRPPPVLVGIVEPAPS